MLKFQLILLITLWANSSHIAQANEFEHIFNTRMLETNEIKIDIYGNAKFGLNKDFTIGTQLLASALDIPNLSIKHKMFSTDSLRTSFNSYFFLGNLDGKNIQFGYWGIGQSYSVSNQLEFSLGFKKFFLAFSDGLFSDNDLDVNIYVTETCVDFRILPNLNLSATVLMPTYQSAAIVTDTVEASISSFIVPGNSSLASPALLATGTIRFGSFNLELGTLGTISSPSLYLNLFWKWI